METAKTILHIDPDYKITYFIFHPGTTIKSSITLEFAIQLLKKDKIDLILSEPHQRAILTPRDLTKKINWKQRIQKNREAQDGRLR
jgi:hypothetical protein